MHCVSETHAFRRSAESLGLSEDEYFRLVTYLSENPDAGDLIPGTGGARKLRFAPLGGGKRGGYRVVTYYCAEDIPVFLMDVYAKGERATLSKGEKNELRQILASFADDYRAMTKRKVLEIRAEVAS